MFPRSKDLVGGIAGSAWVCMGHAPLPNGPSEGGRCPLECCWDVRQSIGGRRARLCGEFEVTLMRPRWLRAVAVFALLIGPAGCDRGVSLDDTSRVGPPSRSSLRAPDSLEGLPRVDNLRDQFRTGIDQPPGVEFVINGYGKQSEFPVLTFEGYRGNSLIMRAVEKVLEKRFGDGQVVGSARCHRTPGRDTTCWRAGDRSVVAVRAWDGRDAPRTAAALDEAWRVANA